MQRCPPESLFAAEITKRAIVVRNCWNPNKWHVSDEDHCVLPELNNDDAPVFYDSADEAKRAAEKFGYTVVHIDQPRPTGR